MKRYLLALALAVSPACGKHNDAQLLQHEAVTLVKYYEPKLVALEARIQKIFKRGTEIPGNLPGIEDVGRRLQEARDTLVKLRGIVPAPDPRTNAKSPVETQAEAAAKENKIVELEKLVHDTQETLAHGVTVIDTNLDAVESWIGQYDNKTLAMATPPAAPAEPAAAPAETPATGQPPGAAQPGAQPAPDQKPAVDAKAPAAAPKAAPQPKAAQPAQPKAAQPAPAQPKAAPPAQPKAAQPKAAQPAPAQPKTPAPAPAQNK